MENAIKILHLEDNRADSLLVQALLKRPDMKVEYHFADNEEEFVSTLRLQKIDLILSDYHLPDYSGIEALLFARNNFPEIPFVFLSGTMGEDVAVESLLNGATDYVLKSNMERLVPSINRAFRESQILKARHKAETDLLRSEENFRASIAESPLGIRIVTIDGDTVYANKAFLDLYGYISLEEFANIPAKKRYTPECFVRHEERKAIRKGGYDVLDYELDIIRKDGTIRNLKVSRKEVLWNGSKHFQVIKIDITATKKLLQDLNAAKEKAEESDRLKTAFLNNISHEIRTPFNGLLGFLSLIQDNSTSPDDRDEYITVINNSAERLMNTINNIVEISQIQTDQTQLTLAETNITQLSNDIYEQYQSEALKKGLKFNIISNLPITTDCITTDSQKLKSILSNLFSNAIKFTKAGLIDFSIRRNEDWLEFSVKDTGIGIPLEKQQSVFERFMQADVSNTRPYEGVGLGLTISKAYVEMLGGKIRVESQVDKGSEFIVALPFIVEQKSIQGTENQDILKHKEEKSLKKQKILIVEDDELSEMLLTQIVKDHFKERLYAKTGLEAVGICHNNPDIDLILMDIKMPPMDGYEATRQIRTFNKEAIIIAQTAYSITGDREKALAAGCNDYIPKPYNRTSMMKIINKWIV